VGTRELILDGRPITVNVRESRRARTLRLTVAPGRPPEVVVPPRCRQRAVDEFLQSHQRWLADKLAALQVLAARPRALPEQPGSVWVAGEVVPVIHDPAVRSGATGRSSTTGHSGAGDRSGAAGRSRAAMLDGRLVVRGDPDDAGAALERWYRREAHRRLGEAADRYAPELGVRVVAISVRDQRTRWGSCSTTGRLSFSWRLAIAPSPILTYVVVHELCHLREFNHSRAFWQLVESLRPDWRDQTAWLREHGHELRAYRPEQGLKLTPG
jgi:hypothetical protein